MTVLLRWVEVSDLALLAVGAWLWLGLHGAPLGFAVALIVVALWWLMASVRLLPAPRPRPVAAAPTRAGPRRGAIRRHLAAAGAQGPRAPGRRRHPVVTG